ncbi:DUF2232 domain-containing protein [Minwuia sp.]|uniref:DUF2232 domain-containing protein n=1 Tax=Minwuia sp. TaxID=2493630 RepID=UPI003A8EE95D
MSTQLLIAAACGLVAALCNLAPLSGNSGGFMLSMIAPMPIFIAGLMQGWLFSLGAGLLAAAITLGIGGTLPAALFTATVVLPASVLVRQALLAQPDQDGDLVWYPVTRLALWLGGVGVVIGLGAMAVIDAQILDGIVDTALAIVAGESEIPAEVRDRVRDFAVRAVPAFIATSAVLSLLLNGSVAQRIAERTGRAVRPRLVFTDMRLPSVLALGLAVLTLAPLFLTGVAGQVAMILAFMLGMLFALQGLIVAHLYARAAGGVPLMAGLYIFGLALLLLLGPVLIMTLLLLGIADAFFSLRRRPSGSTGT